MYVPQAYRSCLRGHYYTINPFILTFPDFLKPHVLGPFCFIDFCYDIIFFRAISIIFHAVQQKCKRRVATLAISWPILKNLAIFLPIFFSLSL